MKQIRVMAAVIERDGKLLLCQRAFHKRHGGLWEFPGGKVHDGESDLEATRRELAEELGVQVMAVGDVLLSVQDEGSPFVIEFLRTEIEGEPLATEHESVEWVSVVDLLAHDLAPSDQRFAEAYLRERSV